MPTRAEFEAVLDDFRGLIEQVPPRYSALHVDGVRAHRLAREGKEVTLEARRVVIHKLELMDFAPPRADIRVVCSKGTYVRSLARDIALAGGTRGHLTFLRRTRIGPFLADEAVSPGKIDASSLMSPVDFFSRLDDIATHRVEEPVRLKISRGQPLEDRFFPAPGPSEGLNAIFDSDDNFLALVEKKGPRYSYKFVGARG
jgi:tRNA pseudouridine55 synthase